MDRYFYILILFLLISCGQENPNNWSFCSDGNGNNINSCTTTQQIGSTYFDSGRDISIYSKDNVYVIGNTEGNLDGRINSGGADFFILKYNSTGWKQWSILAGSVENDYALGSDNDSSGNLYITGHSDGDIGGITNQGNDDAFLTKYDSSGAKLWTKTLGTIKDDQAKDVAVYGTSNVYVVGNTTGDIIGDGLGNDTVHSVYVNSSGNIYAATTGGASISTDSGTSFTHKDTSDGLGHNNINGIHVDSSGNIYAATSAGVSISTNNGTSFSNKTTSQGLGHNTVNDIYVNSSGNIYAATEGAFPPPLIAGQVSPIKQPLMVWVIIQLMLCMSMGVAIFTLRQQVAFLFLMVVSTIEKPQMDWDTIL